MYCLIVLRLDIAAILSVIMTNPLLSTWIKLAIMSNLMSFNNLLILATYLFNIVMTLSELDELIRRIICFLEGPFVRVEDDKIYLFIFILKSKSLSLV